MRAHVRLALSAHDHPVVTVSTYSDVDEGESSTDIEIELDELVSMVGPAAEVRRWVEELSFKVMSLPATS